MKTKKRKKLKLKLVGVNNNAYSIMDAFESQARKEGWSEEEISAVIQECRSSNYDHLLRTVAKLCRNHGL